MQEHHLRAVIDRRGGDAVIPTPEVSVIMDPDDTAYSGIYRQLKHYVRTQLDAMQCEAPEYDMDSEDEAWLAEVNRFLTSAGAPGAEHGGDASKPLSADLFDRLMEFFERQCPANATVRIRSPVCACAAYRTAATPHPAAM